MLNRIFVVASVTLTSTGSAVSSFLPFDTSCMKLPTQLVIKATGQGAYVRLSSDSTPATNKDVLVQGGDHVVMSVAGRRYISVLSDGASSTVSIGALSAGVSGNVGATLDLSLLTTLDPRITFSRTSNATLTDSTGKIAYAPHNLLTNSEDFEASAWTKVRATISANVAVAPDGTTTADKLVEDTSNNTHYVLQASGTVGALETFYFYAKASTIDSVGNGWFLCSFTGVRATNNSNFIYPSTGNGVASYTGDGTSGIFIWGAQLNVGALQSYNSTTPKNLLGFTQEFDNAWWSKINTSVTANAVAAPDGYATGDLVYPSTSGTDRIIWRSSSTTVVVGTSYTLNVYAKAGGLNWLYFGTFGGGTAPTSSLPFFDLQNGVVGQVGSVFTSASITPVGNGWYRCSATGATTGTLLYPVFGVADGNNTGTVTASGTNGVYLWGAQLSNSASVDPYVYNPQAAPTSTAYYGPRFDYNPVTLAANGLLIEEQRTNLITYSDDFSNAAWGKFSGFSVASNTTVAPDGTTTADTVTFTSSSSNTRMNTPSVTAGVTYVFSIWAQSLTGSTGLSIDIGDGTGVNVTVPATLTRISVPIVAGSAGAFIDIVGNGAATMVWWGAQLEAGSFATSYIPTVASQVTRAADNASMLGDNFATWYNQTQGTFYTNGDRIYGGNAYAALAVARNTATGINDRIDIALGTGPGGGAGIYRMTVVAGGVVQADLGDLSAFSANTPYKGAIAYAANDFASSVQGGTVNTDASGSVPSGVNSMDIGNRSSSFQLNGHIRSISYYPTRLPNATLQSITA